VNIIYNKGPGSLKIGIKKKKQNKTLNSCYLASGEVL
jgi:hypothetical protein